MSSGLGELAVVMAVYYRRLSCSAWTMVRITLQYFHISHYLFVAHLEKAGSGATTYSKVYSKKKIIDHLPKLCVLSLVSPVLQLQV